MLLKGGGGGYTSLALLLLRHNVSHVISRVVGVVLVNGVEDQV